MHFIKIKLIWIFFLILCSICSEQSQGMNEIWKSDGGKSKMQEMNENEQLLLEHCADEFDGGKHEIGEGKWMIDWWWNEVDWMNQWIG